MRMSMKFPKFAFFGLGICPDPAYDLPIFYLDLSCTGTKDIAYSTPIAHASDGAYAKKYFDPFSAIFRARHFSAATIRPWMQPFVSPCTVFPMTGIAVLDELKQCGFAYVAHYLDVVSTAEKSTDAANETKIAEARNNYIAQSLSNDVTQKWRAGSSAKNGPAGFAETCSPDNNKPKKRRLKWKRCRNYRLKR